jgi:O-antigen ligase
MIGDFPITGSGFGTFREVFPRYLPRGSVFDWLQAHNDYLEVLLDGGIVALALVAWLAVAYGRRLVRAVRSSRSPARLGLALGIAALAAHAFVDFNHQIPANALLFVTLAALAVPAERAPRSPASSAPA